MAKVVWTAEAERWLLKIHDYIAPDSPVNAFNVVRSIYARAQILERFPLVGHVYQSPSGRACVSYFGATTGSRTSCGLTATFTSSACSTER